MKSLLKSFFLLLTISITACNTYRYDDDFNLLPCERDQIGTVCFDNDTRKLIKMEIGESKVEIEGNTTLCVDVYTGQQEFKGKQGTRRWRGAIAVFACEQYFVELDR